MQTEYRLGRLLENSAWPWLALFFVGLFPFAYAFFLHYPDERHYVDGALQMLDNGDIWAPRTAEGELRLKKPILAYWVTALGFASFGISELGARLPFLSVGCLTLWSTWHIGLFVFSDRAKASLAVAILLCHPPFALASQRSMPDILLCLGLLLSAFGALRLMQPERAGAMPYALFYGGIFFALQSKGLLALVFLAYCWGYALLSKDESWLKDARGHVAGLLSTAVLGGIWFVWAGMRYPEALNAFVDDQVGEKLQFMPLSIVSNGVFYLVYFLILGYLPWLIAALYGYRRSSPQAGNKPRYLSSFIVGWTVLFIFLFSLGNRSTTRYMVPLSPLLALFSVHCLCAVDSVRAARCMRFLTRILAVLLLVLASVLAMMLWQLEATVLAAFVLILWTCIAIGVYRLARMVSSRQQGFLLAGGLFIGWPLLFVALYPVLPDSGGDAARILNRLPDIRSKPVLYLGTPSSANRVRLSLKGKSVVEQHEEWTSAIDTGAYSALVLPREDSESPAFADLAIRGEYVRGFDKVKLRVFIESVLTGDFKAYLEGNTRYFRVLSNR